LEIDANCTAVLQASKYLDRYRLDLKEECQLYSGTERMYILDREQRTVSNFAEITV